MNTSLLLVLVSGLRALAAEPQAYPMMSSVTLPSGAVGLSLPADVIAGDPRQLSTALRLDDATGAEHPFTVLTSLDNEGFEPTAVAWDPTSGFGDGDGRSFIVAESDRPLDGLQLTLDDYERGPWAVTVYSAAGDGWVPVGVEQYLYAFHRVDGGTGLRNTVDLPHKRGPFRVEVRGANDPRVTEITGVVLSPKHVAPVTEDVAVSGPVYTEGGAARYTIDLPGPRAVSGLKLNVEEPIFSRALSIATVEGDYGPNYSIQRAMIGDVRLDETAVEGLDLVTDRLVIDVAGGRDEPLTITGATVSSVGALLLTPDAGPGPQTLYFGGTEPDSESDIAIAADELARVSTRVPATAVTPGENPLYVARPSREGLDGPGAPLNLALWRWERAIVAEPGWTRVPIDGAVLLHARPNLDDLRVVDSLGRSVPFDLRSASQEVEVPLGELKRVEQGEASEIRLSLPADVGAIRRVQLSTDEGVFSRGVDIVRDRGAFSETVRSVTWTGTGTPHSLVIEVNDDLGAELLIRVHNDDDTPLSVTGVRAWTQGRELRTRVPEGGARIVYGNRKASAPDFDLALLGEDLGRVRTRQGTLGPEAAGQGAPMSFVDTALVFVSFAGLGLGLLALTIGALRKPVTANLGPDGAGAIKPPPAPTEPPRAPPAAGSPPPSGETPPESP